MNLIRLSIIKLADLELNFNTDGIHDIMSIIKKYLYLELDNKNIKKGIPKYEPEPKFYNGDQILIGDYFKGWNDTYFFQSSVFRENNNFWLNPFK